MNKAMAFATFVIGAILGSSVTYFKLEKRHKNEIEQIKSKFTYKKPEADTDGSEEDAESEDSEGDIPEFTREKPDISLYVSDLKKSGYLYGKEEDEEESEVPMSDKPYVIPTETYGSIDEYDLVGYTYYADGILADENDEKISDDDIDNIVGEDSLEQLRESEDEIIHVRNDRLKLDYEIVLDQRRWNDIYGHIPYEYDEETE